MKLKEIIEKFSAYANDPEMKTEIVVQTDFFETVYSELVSVRFKNGIVQIVVKGKPTL